MGVDVFQGGEVSALAGEPSSGEMGAANQIGGQKGDADGQSTRCWLDFRSCLSLSG